ncbi:MAG: rhodanese-like domain-containing protein [Acidimicrobiia bacterium]
MGIGELVSAARERIENLTVDQVAARRETGQVVLVDVREPGEAEKDGSIPGSIAAPRGMLEFHADPSSPYHMAELTPTQPVIVYCKSGSRSALAAASLTDLGYAQVAHLDGGVLAWKEAGRPVV